MRRFVLAAIAVSCAFVFGACGGHEASAPLVAEILSTQSFDGDITLDNGVLGAPVSAATFGNVQAGFDPRLPVADTRGFLVLDLSTIPVNASIASATVEVFVSAIDRFGGVQTTFPFFIDMLDTHAG